MSDFKYNLGVVGLGYVGLPLAVEAVSSGLSVVGYDVSEEKNTLINNGQSPIEDISNDDLKSALDNGFIASSDETILADVEYIVISVPTPLTDYQPDLTYVKNTAKEISKHLQVGQLIILESTTYPGCCDEIVKPILEVNGLVSGKDFYLA